MGSRARGNLKRSSIAWSIALAIFSAIGAACQAFLDLEPAGPAPADAGPETGVSTEAGAPDAGDGGGPQVDGGYLANFCVPSKGMQKDAPWPVAGRCASRRAFIPITGPHAPIVKWPGFVEVPIAGIQIDNQGTLFVSVDDYGRGVYAFTPDGGLKWKSATGNSQGCAITADGNLVASTGVNDGGVVSLFSGDGRLRWHSEYHGEFDSEPLVADDGTLYAGDLVGTILRLAPDGGSLGDYAVSGDIWSLALGDDGTLYASGGDNHVDAFANGKKLWSHDVGAPSYVAFGDGIVLAAAQNGQLLALRPDNGDVAWTVSLNGETLSAPAIAPDGTIFVGCSDHLLYGIQDRQKAWSFPADDAVGPPIVAADGWVYFGTKSGTIYGVNPALNQSWKSPGVGDARKQPVMGGDGTLYVWSNETNTEGMTTGHITAFGQ